MCRLYEKNLKDKDHAISESYKACTVQNVAKLKGLIYCADTKLEHLCLENDSRALILSSLMDVNCYDIPQNHSQFLGLQVPLTEVSRYKPRQMRLLLNLTN